MLWLSAKKLGFYFNTGLPSLTKAQRSVTSLSLSFPINEIESLVKGSLESIQVLAYSTKTSLSLESIQILACSIKNHLNFFFCSIKNHFNICMEKLCALFISPQQNYHLLLNYGFGEIPLDLYIFA